MPRYIDADALIKKVFPYDVVDKKSYAINAKTIYEEIQKAPAVNVAESKAIEQIKWERDTAIEQLKSYGVGFGEKADVVNVVRCKDCVYWENGKDYEPYCNHCEGTFSDTTENDFCSHGERKEK